MTTYIHNEIALQSMFGQMRQDFAASGYLSVKWTNSKPRSGRQNDFSHAWYEQLGRELPEDDAAGWKGYCKLHHGVPILRAEDAEFRAFYDGALKGLTYEQKREAMKFVPVTSLMTKAQLTKYLDAVQSDFASRGVYLQSAVAA